MAASGPVTVTTPLGPTALTFRSMKGHEALGRPFEYVVDLVSEDANIALTDLLGQTMAVHLELAEGEHRHFHGFVTSVDFVETLGAATSYRAVVRPWLSLLANTTNCRIFQNKSVPDIVKQVCRDHGFTDLEDALSEDYPKAEYLVQYRESDFNFVSRLLEHAGIYYYFRHAAAAHTLVLADASSAHHSTPGCEQLSFRPPDEHRTRLLDCVDAWQLRQAITSGKVALRDFDFERPRADLSAMASSPKDHAHADFEVYDYPGEYSVKADGETQARVRLEQRQGPFARATGHTNARTFTLGSLFQLTDHPRTDQNKEYLIAYAQLSLSGHELGSANDDGEFTFSCDFDAIDSRLPFRIAPTTPKPVVEGPQTAMVVGKSGAEIWTDKYGRIKVQFHWDRDGKSDENSSCWVRVSEAWAGQAGAACIYRASGQEVIVSFLEGDPDRPIVTGRVYDGTNMPWQALPAQQKKSYFRDEGKNHIMMDATKGKERIELYTPFAETKLAIGAPNSPTPGYSLFTLADARRWITGNDEEDVLLDKKWNVGGNQEETIKKNKTQTVEGSHFHMVKGAWEMEVNGHTKISVGDRKHAITIGEDVGVFAGVKHDTFIGFKTEVSASGTLKLVYGKEKGKTWGEKYEISKKNTFAGSEQEYLLKGGGDAAKIKLDGDGVLIQTGSAEVEMKKSGSISITTDGLVGVETKGSVSIHANKDIALAAPKITASKGSFETKNIKDTG